MARALTLDDAIELWRQLKSCQDESEFDGPMFDACEAMIVNTPVADMAHAATIVEVAADALHASGGGAEIDACDRVIAWLRERAISPGREACAGDVGVDRVDRRP